MKKKAILACTLVLVLCMLPLTAFAHGHRKTAKKTSTYTICTLEDCTAQGRHKHDGAWYCGNGICVQDGACYSSAHKTTRQGHCRR